MVAKRFWTVSYSISGVEYFHLVGAVSAREAEREVRRVLRAVALRAVELPALVSSGVDLDGAENTQEGGGFGSFAGLSHE
jgi:hypothetical protein